MSLLTPTSTSITKPVQILPNNSLAKYRTVHIDAVNGKIAMRHPQIIKYQSCRFLRRIDQQAKGSSPVLSLSRVELIWRRLLRRLRSLRKSAKHHDVFTKFYHLFCMYVCMDGYYNWRILHPIHKHLKII